MLVTENLVTSSESVTKKTRTSPSAYSATPIVPLTSNVAIEEAGSDEEPTGQHELMAQTKNPMLVMLQQWKKFQEQMRQDAQTARDEHDKKMLALNDGVAAFADNMIEKFIENDSEEACKAFFENADVETNRAIIEKLWEADPDKLIKAVVENLADDVIEKIVAEETDANMLANQLFKDHADEVVDKLIETNAKGLAKKALADVFIERVKIASGKSIQTTRHMIRSSTDKTSLKADREDWGCQQNH